MDKRGRPGKKGAVWPLQGEGGDTSSETNKSDTDEQKARQFFFRKK